MKKDLEKWKDDINYHRNALNDLMAERIRLKDEISIHIKEYFDFDNITFNSDFSKIILKFQYDTDPVIRDGSLDNLGLDFIISHDYSEEFGHGVVIELYPYGLSDEEED